MIPEHFVYCSLTVLGMRQQLYFRANALLWIQSEHITVTLALCEAYGQWYSLHTKKTYIDNFIYVFYSQKS